MGRNTNFPNYPTYAWDYECKSGIIAYNNRDMLDNNIMEGQLFLRL